jgi:Ca2+/Na+ antiporter
VVVTSIRDAEKWATVAAVPVTIIILFLAALWARRESVVGMVVTLVCYLGGLAYFIFKLARMYQPSHEGNYLPVRKNLTSFAVITIILILLTIVNASMCMANFNKGLKKHVYKRNLGADEEKPVQMTNLPDLNDGSGGPNRMTID